VIICPQWLGVGQLLFHLWPKLIFAQPMFSTSILTFSHFNNSWKLLVTSSYPPRFIHVFFFLNNTSENKANILTTPFQTICTITPSSKFWLMDIQCSSNSHHSCSRPSSRTWFIVQLVFTNVLPFISNIFHCPTNPTLTTPSFNKKPSSLFVYSINWPIGYSFVTLCPWQWMHKDAWYCLWCMQP